jgi:hypothetical protein
MGRTDRFETDAWALAVPPGMVARIVNPPPECTSMVHVRGEIVPDAPAFAIVSTRAGVTVSRLAKKLAGSLMAPRNPPRAIAVPGTKHAVRVDGLIEMEEGLSADGVERITIVITARRHDVLVLTVRTRPNDDVRDAVESLVGSFVVRQVRAPEMP